MVYYRKRVEVSNPTTCMFSFTLYEYSSFLIDQITNLFPDVNRAH